MERPAGRSQDIDPFFNGRIFQKRRCMVGLDAGVDDQRPLASPVFAADGCADPVDVGGWIGAGEGDPEEIVEGPAVNSLSSTMTISGNEADGIAAGKESQKAAISGSSHSRSVVQGGPLTASTPGRADPWFTETFGQAQACGKFGRPGRDVSGRRRLSPPWNPC